MLSDLPGELEMRPHLLRPRVSWDAERRCVLVELEDAAFGPEQAGRSLSEELFAAACAILSDAAGLRVDVLDVRPGAGR
jgi:hypothetical protein